MTSKELADELHQGCKELGWTGVELARAAGVTYETARRALGALGSPLLSNTTKLLVAVRRELVVRRITTTQPLEGEADHPTQPDPEPAATLEVAK